MLQCFMGAPGELRNHLIRKPCSSCILWYNVDISIIVVGGFYGYRRGHRIFVGIGGGGLG